MLTRIDIAFVRINFTSFSFITFLTDAIKPVNSVRTGPLIHTRIAIAFVDVGSAQVVVVTRGAVAPERVHVVDAMTPVTTRAGGAFVYVRFTKSSRVTGLAYAAKVVDSIFTFGAISTRIASTVVYIQLTHRSVCAQWTGTPKSIDEVLTTSGIVTRTAGAFVDLDIAVLSGETRITEADVVAEFVDAATVVATDRHALVDVIFTPCSIISFSTNTGVAVDLIPTRAAVKTRTTQAIIHVDLTRLTSKSNWTAAFKSGHSVNALTSVTTG